jgi:hypothetical protein
MTDAIAPLADRTFKRALMPVERLELRLIYGRMITVLA